MLTVYAEPMSEPDDAAVPGEPEKAPWRNSHGETLVQMADRLLGPGHSITEASPSAPMTVRMEPETPSAPSKD